MMVSSFTGYYPCYCCVNEGPSSGTSTYHGLMYDNTNDTWWYGEHGGSVRYIISLTMVTVFKVTIRVMPVIIQVLAGPLASRWVYIIRIGTHQTGGQLTAVLD